MEEEFLERGKREMEGTSEIKVQLMEERDKWDSVSMGFMRREFVARLPDKIKECLNPGNNFHIDESKSETLIKGEKEYYEKQFDTLRSFEEIDSLNASNEINEAQNLEEQKETEFVIKISNYANIAIWALKIYATIISGSIAIAASTLDSLLNLMAGGFLWFTYISMKNKIIYKDPNAKLRVQPIGIIIFTAVLAILGFEVLVQSFERLTENGNTYKMNSAHFAWFYLIMFIVTIVKLVLWIYCKNSGNKTIHAFSEDHYFDTVINMFSWAAAVLGNEFYWWIDPIGALIIAIYSISNWSKIVWKTTVLLIGQSAPQEMLQKLIYMVIRHHPEIKRVGKLKAYTFGVLYFVEVELQVSEDLPFKETHEIEASLRVQIEKLPEVERAFIHLHFESNHYNMVDIEITEDLPFEEAREIEEPLQGKIEKNPEIEGTSVHLNSESDQYVTEDVKVPDYLPLEETCKIEEPSQEKIEKISEIEGMFFQLNSESNDFNNISSEDVEVPEDYLSLKERHKIEEQPQEKVETSEVEKEFVHVEHKTENLVHMNFKPDYKPEQSIITEITNEEPEEQAQDKS